MSPEKLCVIVEAALLAADEPLPIDRLLSMFDNLPDEEKVDKKQVREAVEELAAQYEDAGRGIELKEVASGFRIQIRKEMAEYVNALFEERAPRMSRAFLETLAIIAYRQPITRGEIEDIRGVSVSSGIVRTLQEREWIRVAGHRDVPGRPAVFITTKAFLDYFNLDSLSSLPSLAELRDFEELNQDMFADELPPTATIEPPGAGPSIPDQAEDEAADAPVDEEGAEAEQGEKDQEEQVRLAHAQMPAQESAGDEEPVCEGSEPTNGADEPPQSDENGDDQPAEETKDPQDSTPH